VAANLPREKQVLILLGGLVAGIALYFLTESSDRFDKDLILAVLTAFAYGGFSLMLLAHIGDPKKSALWAVGITLFVFILGFQYFTHVGFHEGLTRYSDAIPNYFVSIKFTFFILLAFLQCFREGDLFDYGRLYINAWHNAVLGLLPLVLVGLVFGALFLASALFELIGLTFLEKLLKETAFNFPLAGALFALVVIYLRENDRVLSVASRFGVAMFRIVGLVICVAALVFLLYLPVAGLDKLWNSGYAASIILTVVIVTGFYANAYVEDGDGLLWGKISTVRKMLVTIAVAVMPIFVALGAYAFYLRISQYGFTPDRIYAVPILLFAAFYSVGYCVKIYKHRLDWAKNVQVMNIRLALFAAGSALLLQVSLISPYTLAAMHQNHRLVDGIVSADDFDFAALKYSAARPGRLKFDRLVAEDETLNSLGFTGSIAGLREAENPYSFSARRPHRQKKLLKLAHFKTLPKGMGLQAAADGGLIAAIGVLPRWPFNIQRCTKKNPDVACAIWAVDADGDGVDEYFVFVKSKGPIVPASNSSSVIALMVPPSDGETDWKWRNVDLDFLDSLEVDFIEAIEAGTLTFQQPKYPNLKVGNQLFRILGEKSAIPE
jgi:hypothetical protein